jgi:hypothetical protein
MSATGIQGADLAAFVLKYLPQAANWSRCCRCSNRTESRCGSPTPAARSMWTIQLDGVDPVAGPSISAKIPALAIPGARRRCARARGYRSAGRTSSRPPQAAHAGGPNRGTALKTSSLRRRPYLPAVGAARADVSGRVPGFRLFQPFPHLGDGPGWNDGQRLRLGPRCRPRSGRARCENRAEQGREHGTPLVVAEVW